jgi:hypothetical protein
MQVPGRELDDEQGNKMRTYCSYHERLVGAYNMMQGHAKQGL